MNSSNPGSRNTPRAAARTASRSSGVAGSIQYSAPSRSAGEPGRRSLDRLPGRLATAARPSPRDPCRRRAMAAQVSGGELAQRIRAVQPAWPGDPGLRLHHQLLGAAHRAQADEPALRVITQEVIAALVPRSRSRASCRICTISPRLSRPRSSSASAMIVPLVRIVVSSSPERARCRAARSIDLDPPTRPSTAGPRPRPGAGCRASARSAPPRRSPERHGPPPGCATRCAARSR